MADIRYKSLKSWKIDNIDLTQHFSLSIFSINGDGGSIWWVPDFHRFPLSIDKNPLIATDFYRYRFLSIDYSGDYRLPPTIELPGSCEIQWTITSKRLTPLKVICEKRGKPFYVLKNIKWWHKTLSASAISHKQAVSDAAYIFHINPLR